MRFMNDYDLDYAISRFTRSAAPNRLALALVVNQLRLWTDSHSDGWAYWRQPVRAAAKAIELIDSRTSAEDEHQENNDISEREMLEAVKPIERFLRRASATPADREMILRAVTT